ncbi:hypothetical protein NQ186_11620 [Pseudomonas zeae]|uniref:hypothetical protein n=1 Tax=Pseudomonas zeae TaxID=2745510 RepID=UPI00214994AB|nr:hypothetical protein [Pseudomonas zeae]UUT14787.1 hypothetical protein NQ186_11620 [Pseudomonas zeae]
MNLPVLFQLTRGVIQSTNAEGAYVRFRYRVFDCLQKNDENLVPMPESARHRFAVMYRKGFSHDLMAVLKRAYRIGGISPVKLIDVSGNSLYVFLDAKVASSTVAAIEAKWAELPSNGRYGHWKVHFASESEIWSGRSDYVYLLAAKEILESHKLGIMDSTVPIPNAVNFNDFRGYASAKHRSLQQPQYALLPTSVVRHLHTVIQFISYLQKRAITEGDFRLTEFAKEQLHLYKIALQLVTGLRLPSKSVDRSLAVSHLRNSVGSDSFIKKIEARMGHKSQSSTSDYLFPRTAMGVCSNNFLSKHTADQAHYLRFVECTRKPSWED